MSELAKSVYLNERHPFIKQLRCYQKKIRKYRFGKFRILQKELLKIVNDYKIQMHELRYENKEIFREVHTQNLSYIEKLIDSEKNLSYQNIFDRKLTTILNRFKPYFIEAGLTVVDEYQEHLDSTVNEISLAQRIHLFHDYFLNPSYENKEYIERNQSNNARVLSLILGEPFNTVRPTLCTRLGENHSSLQPELKKILDKNKIPYKS